MKPSDKAKVENSPVAAQIPRRSINIKRPTFSYLHLTLLSSDPSSADVPVDILTARTYLTSALEHFLGMTGTAIVIDFLKVEARDVWIRVSREDTSQVVGALSQWAGKEGSEAWRIKGRGEWLGSLSAGDGRELFND